VSSLEEINRSNIHEGREFLEENAHRSVLMIRKGELMRRNQ
jgi:hypothetical protein